MPISIVGDGSITGLTAGGLPDASVTNDDLATGIASSKLSGALPALDGSSLTGVGVDGIVSTANATAITIDSNENVGLGVTPEISTNTTGLYVGSRTSVVNWGNGSYFPHNAYESSSSWKYRDTAAAGIYSRNNNGDHVFEVAPSGTADAAISFTTALTIHNDGQSAFKGIVTETTSQSLSNGSQITHNGSSMVSCNASSSCTLASDSIQDPSRDGHILILTCGDNPPSKFTLSSSNTAKITLTSNWSPDWGDTLLLFGTGNWWHEMGRGTNSNY